MLFPQVKKILSLPNGSKKKEVPFETPVMCRWLTTYGTIGSGVIVRYNDETLHFQDGSYVFTQGIKTLTIDTK